MRSTPGTKLELCRLREGYYASKTGDMHGAFKVIGPKGAELLILSGGLDDEYFWEHVSVSLQNRAPNWQEMCWVKELFWDDTECVVQFHPPKSEYVNHHPNCLHLWKPRGIDMPMPPSILVGPKDATG